MEPSKHVKYHDFISAKPKSKWFSYGIPSGLRFTYDDWDSIARGGYGVGEPIIVRFTTKKHCEEIQLLQEIINKNNLR